MTMTVPNPTDNQTASTTDSIIFPDGLVGCQDWKNFILMTDDGDEELPVAILQSLDDASIRMSTLFWYCDSSKAHAELGFETRDPDQTLRDTVASLRQRKGLAPR